MLNEDAIRTATEHFMKNAFWKKLYEGAPSRECRRYMELTFYHSLNTDDDSYHDDLERIKDKMSIADWEYAGKHFGNNMYRAYCNKRIAALKANQDKEGNHDGQ